MPPSLLSLREVIRLEAMADRARSSLAPHVSLAAAAAITVSGRALGAHVVHPILTLVAPRTVAAEASTDAPAPGAVGAVGAVGAGGKGQGRPGAAVKGVGKGAKDGGQGAAAMAATHVRARSPAPGARSSTPPPRLGSPPQVRPYLVSYQAPI